MTSRPDVDVATVGRTWRWWSQLTAWSSCTWVTSSARRGSCRARPQRSGTPSMASAPSGTSSRRWREQYGVAPGDVADDVTRLLRELDADGLLRLPGSSHGRRPARRPQEAAPLVHALCERVARDVGVRVLAIKGPVVAMQGLRAPRVSADVDVLVHPDDLDTLHRWPAGRRLARRSAGHRRYGSCPCTRSTSCTTTGRWASTSTTTSRAFSRPRAEVFEVLWARRDVVELAGVPVTVCDPVSQVAVVGLHLLREDPEGLSARVQDLVERARDRLGASGAAELLDSGATDRLRRSPAAGPRRAWVSPTPPRWSRLIRTSSSRGSSGDTGARDVCGVGSCVSCRGGDGRARCGTPSRSPTPRSRSTTAEATRRRGRAMARLRRLGKVSRLLPGILRGLMGRATQTHRAPVMCGSRHEMDQ